MGQDRTDLHVEVIPLATMVLRATPSMSFETGAPAYTWLNRIQAIAKGRLQEDRTTVCFEVYELR